MLDLRPTCEHCDRPLPRGAPDARICTFECTFCADCAEGLLGGVCPNCAGELVVRPVRPEAYGESGAERVHAPVDLDAHVRRLDDRPVDADHPGVVLRRYADAWQRGDLDRLVGCYGEDFTLHYGGGSRYSGTHRGRDAALAVMAEVSVLAPRELVAVHDIEVGRHGGTIVVTERLTRDGETSTVERLLRYRVDGGLLRECRLIETDPETVDRFWR